MMRHLAILVLLCLYAARVAAVSDAAARVEATFLRVRLPPTPPPPQPSPAINNECANEIVHQVVATYRGINPDNPMQQLDGVRWRHLTVNRMSCSRSSSAATATRFYVQQQSPPGTSDEEANIFFLVGEDNTPRRCQAYVQTFPNHYFFTDDLPRFRVRLTDAGLLPRGNVSVLDAAKRGTIYMFSRPFQPGSDGAVSIRTSCLYVVSTPTPSPSPDPTPEPVEDDGSICFPGSASVVVRGKGRVAMRDLVLGDFVLVKHNLYSPVILFGHFGKRHRQLQPITTFVQIATDDSNLRISAGHYVRTGAAWFALKRAGEFRVGDTIWLNSGVGSVRNVTRVTDTGLFSPVTAHGDIMVDAVIASCYTEALQPAAAHALLLPLRAAAGVERPHIGQLWRWRVSIAASSRRLYSSVTHISGSR